MANDNLQPIGLQAILDDADFQKGLAAYLQGVDKATQKTEQGAEKMSVMQQASAALGGAIDTVAGVISGGLTIAIGAAVAAATALVTVFAGGIFSLQKWGEQIDQLQDLMGLSAGSASTYAYALNTVGVSVEEGAGGFNYFVRSLAQSKQALDDAAIAYRNSVSDINAANTEAASAIAEKWSTAQADAASKTLDIWTQYTDKRNQMEADLQANLADMQDSFNKQVQKSIKDANKNAAKSEKDAKKQNTRDLAELDKEEQRKLNAASTDEEKAKIKAEFALKRQDLADKLKLRLSDIEEAKKERLAEIEELRKEDQIELDEKKKKLAERTEAQIIAARNAAYKQAEEVEKGLARERKAYDDATKKRLEDYDKQLKKARETLAKAQESNPLAKALKQLGINAYDAKGNLKSFDELMPDIMDAFAKLPPGVDAGALALQLFGRSGSKFLDFLRLGKDGLKDAQKEAEEFGLTLDETGASGTEEFGRQMNRVQLLMQGLMVTIGKEVLPIVSEFIREFLKWAKEHMPEIRKAIQGFAQDLKDRIIPAAIELVKWFSENFPKVQKAIDDAWKTIQPILKKLQELFAQVSDTDLSGVAKGWQQVQKAISDAWKFIQPILDKIFKELSKFWTEIQPKLQKAWDNISKTVKETWDYIWKNVIKPIVETIQKFIIDHWNDIEKVIEGVMKEIQGVITVVWNAIKGIIKVALDIIGGDFDAAGKDWQDTMTAIWKGIEQIIDGAWKIIQGIVGLALAALLQLIQSKMTDIQNAIYNLFQGAVSFVQTAWNNIINAVTTMLTSLINGIKAKAQEIIDAITAPFIAAVNNLLSVNLFDLGKKVVQGLLDGVISIASSIKGALVAPFINAITAIWNTDWGAVGRHVMELIANGLEAIKNRVIAAIQGPLQQLIDLIQSLLRSIGIGSISSLGAFGAMNMQAVPVGVTSGSSFVSNRNVNNYFNMTVNTSAGYPNATRDFGIMRALVSGG